MTRATELRKEISAKKTVIENLQRAGKTTEALKEADEINHLVDSLQIEEAKEKADFENFLKNPKVPAGITLDSVGITPAQKYQGGVIGDEYHENFFNSLRKSFEIKNEYLRESVQTKGGYLVPAQFGNEILSKLTDENILRQITTVVQTDSNTELKIVATPPTASWISEGSQIPFTDETFSQITLNAFKLGASIRVSNELLADSFYDLQGHIATEFSKALAAEEERTFIEGNGVTEPQGILTALDGTDNISPPGLSADALIHFSYRLERPYRRNASWLMNDSTFAQILSLKDGDGRFLVQNAIIDGEPPKLLGKPVFLSPYVPTVTIESKVYAQIIFGDFSKYDIAERGTRIVKALRELYAMSDLTAFLMIERIDGKVIDTNAFKVLPFEI